MNAQNPSEPSDEEIAEYAARLEKKGRAVARAEELLGRPDCVVCNGHIAVLERDEFGFALVIGFDHEPNCPLRDE